jgi:ABC-type uncharacterized transport system involved in gliding motility auxiliary subunit
VALRRRESLDSREGIDKGRMARESVGSIVYVLAVVAAVAVVLVISSRLRVPWDATRFGENTLAPQTVEILKGLEAPVKLVGLFTDKHPERQGYWERLQAFKRESGRLEVEFVDPIERPGAVRALGLDVEEFGSRRDGVTVVVGSERKMVVRDTKEESLANAILEVGSGEKRVVGFVLGYGEPDPTSPSDRGLSRAVEALRAEYYDVREVRLAAGIPSDMKVVIVAGPAAPIPPAEIEVLGSWLDRGGRLLALLDPGTDEGSGLGTLLERYGLRLDGAQVLEPQSSFNRNGNPEFVRAVEYSRHGVVRGFGVNLPSEYPIVSAVSHFEPGDPTLFHEGLVRSSRTSVGIAPDGMRRQGPFDLAAVSWKRLPAAPGKTETEVRVILFGDSDFAVNAYLPLGANRNLFLNSVAWLSQARGLVTIRRMPLEGQTIALDLAEYRLIRIGVFAAPLLVLFAGIVVLLRRRGL